MVSIIVSWRDRLQLRETCTPFLESLPTIGGELIIVNFGGDVAMLRNCLQNTPSPIKVVNVVSQATFNKPSAQNLGSLHASGDLLFFCDCDIFLQRSVLETMVEETRKRPDVFTTVAGVRETTVNSRKAGKLVHFGYELHLVLDNGREVWIHDHEEDARTGIRDAPGLLMVSRRHFEMIQGYNSSLDGWGWEDQDMICRLTLGAGLQRLKTGHLEHISHSEAERIGAYPYNNRWDSRDRMFRRALEAYNEGRFEGSLDKDLQRLSDTTEVLFIGS